MTQFTRKNREQLFGATHITVCTDRETQATETHWLCKVGHKFVTVANGQKFELGQIVSAWKCAAAC